jgi:hypothetical protein
MNSSRSSHQESFAVTPLSTTDPAFTAWDASSMPGWALHHTYFSRWSDHPLPDALTSDTYRRFGSAAPVGGPSKRAFDGSAASNVGFRSGPAFRKPERPTSALNIS